LGVFRQGEFKNTINFLLQKVHVETKIKNFDKNFDVSFSSIFFGFIAFSGVFQRREFKNTTNVLQKKSRRKFLTKKSTKNPKPTFSRIVFYHVFGRFSMLDEESSKTR
jgi:hypothetical protein